VGKLVRFGQSDDETLVLTVQPRRRYFWTSVELFHLLLSFFSEICRPKFSKLTGSWPEVTAETQRPELQRLSSIVDGLTFLPEHRLDARSFKNFPAPRVRPDFNDCHLQRSTVVQQFVRRWLNRGRAVACKEITVTPERRRQRPTLRSHTRAPSVFSAGLLFL
jgi:hypothetical protein